MLLRLYKSAANLPAHSTLAHWTKNYELVTAAEADGPLPQPDGSIPITQSKFQHCIIARAGGVSVPVLFKTLTNDEWTRIKGFTTRFTGDEQLPITEASSYLPCVHKSLVPFAVLPRVAGRDVSNADSASSPPPPSSGGSGSGAAAKTETHSKSALPLPVAVASTSTSTSTNRYKHRDDDSDMCMVMTPLPGVVGSDADSVHQQQRIDSK